MKQSERLAMYRDNAYRLHEERMRDLGKLLEQSRANIDRVKKTVEDLQIGDGKCK